MQGCSAVAAFFDIAFVYGLDDEVGNIDRPEFGKERFAMCFDCVFGDEHGGCDFA